ncbi:3-hydroxyisobutyryl-CoA hydrolase, mitochondrial-like [Styela clava]
MNSIRRLQIISRHLCNSTRSQLFNLSRRRTGFTSFPILRQMSSNSTDEVIFERFGTKGVITLNRPKSLNALNLSMVNKIYPKLKEWEENPETTMIIMKASGEKAFCAGGDILSATGAGTAGSEFFNKEYVLNHAIGTCLVPYIAFIDGITMGGGVGLSVHGQFRIATERTLFAMPETAIGLFPDVGGSYVLPRLGHSLGLYLALTGFRLKGRDVYKSGIATHMVDSENLPKVEMDLLALENPSTQDIMDLLRRYHLECKTGRERDFILADKLDDINRLFAGDTMEEIFQNLENEGTQWAKQQLETLRKMSPTSMKVTLRQLTAGADLDLPECLIMESRIARGCLRNHDFYEGVRAVLVDRDHSPKWQPDTLEGVTDDIVEDHFSLIEGDTDLEL